MLPNSVRNLRNLQTLKLFGTLITHIPSQIWSLHKLRHIFLWFDASPNHRNGGVMGKMVMGSCNKIVETSQHRIPPPRIDRLRDLHTMDLCAGSWIAGGLDKLTNLRHLGIQGNFDLYYEALKEHIKKLDCLRSLYLVDSLEGQQTQMYLPDISFSNHVHLYHLRLHGQLVYLPNIDAFPPNLTELSLMHSGISAENPLMATLEKLPNLTKLELAINSFMGTKLTCSTDGFAKLQVLRLVYLTELLDWEVEERAMPTLKDLYIIGCEKLRMHSNALKRISSLQKLSLAKMPEEFKRGLREGSGEVWHKIQHVSSFSIKF